MKILASSLFCLVLAASQCLAIKGGPDYGGRGVKTTGIYAGVLVPPVTGAPPMESDNSLALFTVTIPKTGLASGTIAVFRNGHYYSGTILATADPDSTKLYADISASFTTKSTRTFTTTSPPPPPDQNFGGDCTSQTTTVAFSDGTITRTTTVTCQFTYTANGKISDLSGVQLIRNPNIFSSASVRLVGNASLEYQTNDPSAPTSDTASITYKVLGFKQSEVQ